MGCSYAFSTDDSSITEVDVSRKNVAPVTPLLAMRDWLMNIKASYVGDPFAQSILTGNTTHEHGKYHIGKHDGLIYRRATAEGKPAALYVPNNLSLRQSIIDAHHGTAYAPHFGARRTYEKIRRHFHWPTLETDVDQSIKACLRCLRSKYRTTPKPLLHIPFGVPEAPFACIGMDFKTGLPLTRRGNNAFWVIVDYFSGLLRVIPLAETGLTAEKLARLFVEHYYKHHGLPVKIVSDRDPKFTAAFWQTFWKHLCTILNISTARNPWTDGKSERAIKTVVELLRAHAEQTSDWDLDVAVIEFNINDTVDPIRGFTPFECAGYGAPLTPISLLMRDVFPDSARAFRRDAPDDPLARLDRWSELAHDVRTRLYQTALRRRRELAQRGYIPYDFKPGDKVLIENPKAETGLWKKLSAFEPRYIGPYTYTWQGSRP